MGRRGRNGEPAMFAVIFELQPRPEKFDEYLELAKYLKPRLEAIDGFIDIDRFSSRRAKGRLLSLSTWRDEKAIVRWRTDRKSTRLNSCHLGISYAVFCLKKKNKIV